jgi:hypothetical protein
LSEECARVIQSIAALASVAVAAVAIFIALRGERRGESRFQTQLDQAQKIAEAQAKPLLSLFTLVYTNLKGIRVVNCGQGTALIRSVHMSRGERRAQNAASLFDLDDRVVWDTFWVFTGPSHMPLRAGQELRLLELSAKGLKTSGLTEADANRILQAWQSQIEEVQIQIDYSDIFENSQSPCLLTTPAA